MSKGSGGGRSLSAERTVPQEADRVKRPGRRNRRLACQSGAARVVYLQTAFSKALSQRTTPSRLSLRRGQRGGARRPSQNGSWNLGPEDAAAAQRLVVNDALRPRAPSRKPAVKLAEILSSAKGRFKQ